MIPLIVIYQQPSPSQTSFGLSGATLVPAMKFSVRKLQVSMAAGWALQFMINTGLILICRHNRAFANFNG